ncbi:MAG: Jag N-terminal domain-containing protein [Candidatus Eremiobacteraeota bacterium]|nr:Jag N-terminal domain-containing protein [Candidatus Eremiobacteraeota bacterium]
MKEVVESGHTVEDAKKKAMKELGVESEDKVEVDIIDEGSKGIGIFGWGTRFARVRVRLIGDSGGAEEAKVTRKETVVKKARKLPDRIDIERKSPGRKKPEPTEITRRPASTVSKPVSTTSKPVPIISKPASTVSKPVPIISKPASTVSKPVPIISKPASTVSKPVPMTSQTPTETEEKNELKGEFAPEVIISEVLDLMGLQGDVLKEKVEGEIVYNIKGQDLGILIGKHGQTLESVQFIINIILMRKTGVHRKVTIDVEGYRARREKSLKELARRLADKAKREKRKVVLEPMLPSERRIIHMALQKNPHVSTFSKGEEPMRKVIISPQSMR